MKCVIMHSNQWRKPHFAKGFGSGTGMPSLKFFNASKILSSLSAAAKDILHSYYAFSKAPKSLLKCGSLSTPKQPPSWNS